MSCHIKYVPKDKLSDGINENGFTLVWVTEKGSEEGKRVQHACVEFIKKQRFVFGVSLQSDHEISWLKSVGVWAHVQWFFYIDPLNLLL